MTAITLDLGQGAVTVLLALVGVITLIVQNVFTKRQQKVTATKAEEAANELKPNGGTSLRDAIDRIEANQETFKAQMDGIEARLATLEHPPAP